jgi:carbon monoxide dehydrogenase subunit G
MKVSGEATLSAPVAEVYRALHDPEVLVRTIPGCQRLDLVGEDAYQMTVNAGVAAIKGAFSGSVRLVDAQPPHAFALNASGSGAPGTVSTHVKVRLADNGGGTLLHYDADADVGGPIGGVGQRLLASVAHKTAHEFFTAVNGVLAAPPAAAPPTTEGVERPPAGAVATSWSAPATRTDLGLRPFLAGAVFGAGLTVLGALVGGFVASRALRGRR